jgi:hypothetical protein
MAITNAILINSPAKDSVNDGTALPDQTGIANNQIIFPSTIATNNGDLAGSPHDTFVGRLVMIRRGSSTEETKYMNEVSADGFTASVHENWDTPPASGDSYDVSYLTWDVDTVGNAFKVVLKAFFALLDGHSIESDNAITPPGEQAFQVRSNGLMQTGYLAAGNPISAGSWFSTADVDSDPGMFARSGSYVRFYDAFMSCVKTNQTNLNGHIIWNKGKVYAGQYQSSYTSSDSVAVTDFTVEGRSLATDLIYVDNSFTSSGFNVVSTNGLTTPTTTGTETIIIGNPLFANNLRNILVWPDKTWNIVNPIWTINTGSQDNILFSGSQNTTGEVNEQYSIDLTTQLADGTLITGSGMYVYEGLLSRGGIPDIPYLPTTGSTDSNGEFSSTITTRRFTSGSSNLIVSQSGDFAMKVYKYLYFPFVTALTVDDAIAQPVTMLLDSNITNQTQSSAIAAALGVTASNPTYDTTLIQWANAPATFSVGEGVTGSISDARGTVVYIPEKDEGAGTGYMLLDFRNTASFLATDELTGSLAGTGSTVETTQSYAWRVECDSEDLNVVYDYLAARMAQVPLLPSYSLAIAWGEDEQSQLLYTDGTNYYTERNTNLQEGIFLTNYGTGNVSYFTDNSGNTYVPPTQVLLEVYSAASGARCAIIAEGTSGPEIAGTQLMNELADASGYASEGYLYKGDQLVTVRARKAGKIPYGLATTIASNGLVVIALDIDDDNYDPSY